MEEEGSPLSARAIFDHALAIQSPTERQAYLLQACDGKAELREKVDGLLTAYEAAGSYLESAAPNFGLGATLDQPGFPLREGPGSLVGPYKLLQQIGEGGMGLVFLAEQTHPVRRQVAVKVIKAGMDTRQVIARFGAERQALALMDHPNIAKVLDAGATDSGRPYFVMELVKGVSITKYCDEHRLTPHDRLELFVQVCRAVQHAHTKGIIHRDLKPSNVLVALYDGKPVPKVIDFGVAKATGGRLTEATVFTGFGTVVGTPEYMSPEQAELNQLDIDTRSDVYSLGVILYELLTGSTPLERKQLTAAAMLEVLRVVREQDPPRPSTRLSTTDQLASIAASRGLEPRKLGIVVRGELDWIVMRALEKDRTRRYETANGLADDVRRYLNDEPVQACPPSVAYKVRKLLRRNRVALGVTALLGLMLLASVGGIASSIGWATRDRDARQAAVDQDANLALKEAERLLGQGKYPDALSAAKRAEGILAGGGTDELRARVQVMRNDLEMVLCLEGIRLQRHVVNTGTEHDPRTEATYARVFRDYGIDVESLPAGEAAERIRARPIRVELVLGLDDWLLVGSWKAGRDNWAAADMKKALAESKLPSWEAGHENWKALLALARSADPDPWRNRLRETLEPQKRKAALKELAASDDPQKLATANLFLLNHSSTMNDAPALVESVFRRARQYAPSDFWVNLGLAYSLGKLKPPQADEAIRYFSVALALRPDSHFVHASLGSWLQRRGRADEAIDCFREAIRLKPDYALVYNNLGKALGRQGKMDEAAVAFQRAITLDPDSADSHYNLGLALYERGDVNGAIVAYRSAIALKPDLAIAHNNLGFALRKSDPAGAIAAYRQAIALKPDDVIAHQNLGRALQGCGDWADAVAAFEKVIALKPELPSAHNDLAWLLANCPDLRFRNADRAVELAKQAVKLAPAEGGYCNTLGAAHYRAGNWEAATVALNKSIELRNGGDSFDLFFMAMARWRLGEKQLAARDYDRAVQWMEKNQPQNEEMRRFRTEAAGLLNTVE
jgi:serine/threonine protein kinase/tetratricopeptide (TPR) repeat protein